MPSIPQTNIEQGVGSNNEPLFMNEGNVVEHKIRSSAEAMEESGITWTVSKQQKKLERRDGTYAPVPGSYSIVRDSDEKVLGSEVGKIYQPFQPKEAFSFFDPFLHENDAFITSAFTLDGGKYLAITVEIEGFNSFDLGGGEEMKSYLCLLEGYTSGFTTKFKFGETRPICANTLRQFLGEKGELLTVRHDSKQKENILKIQANIDLAKKTFVEDAALYKELMKKKVSLDDARNYFEQLFEKEMEDAAKAKGIPLSEFDPEEYRSFNLCLKNFCFEENLQSEAIVNSSYSLFNAATAFATHQRKGDRLEYIHVGKGSAFLEKARELAMAI